MEGTLNCDKGSSLRDAVLSLTNYGVCHESEWPYESSQLTTKPSTKCYKNAKSNT